MTATLRERAEHAAKYGSNLVVPARELLALLDHAERPNSDALAAQWQAEAEPWREQAEWLSARLHAVHELHQPDADGNCGHCTRGRLHPVPAPCDTATALAEGGELR
ncbi:MAG: hypothetical protein ACTH6N_13735 [Brachybacterium tyrofermentans]|uniref:hypothetical protein n=1 Tax=Brachybacterium tyrofermentans TaxID=47848 RepID=UPI0018663512|nr:hypothetical protein [Brachybacterium tyrofermentans]